ncbi:MAG: PASTA domain-containing protein, partial [Acidimicrobiales bacterium]
ARAIAGGEDNLTQTGSVMGTATYFSPEQAQGHPVDPRSDLYSLGVVMYEMATGRAPFTGDSPVAIAYKHVQETPANLRQSNPTVPEAYEAITLKLLAKAPDDRYATAEDLRGDLRRFLDGRAVKAEQRPVSPSPALTAPVAPSRPLPPPVYPDESGRRRTGWFIAVLLLLLVALGALLFAFAQTLGITGEDKVTVPTVIGQNGFAAIGRLRDAGLEVVAGDIRMIPSDTVEKGMVISQDPVAGTEVAKGTSISLTTSTGPPGPEKKDLPRVEGQSEEAARTALATAGFTNIGPSDVRNDPSVGEGSVISQSPDPGLQPVDVRITLVISDGPEATTTGSTAPPSTAPETTASTTTTTTTPPSTTASTTASTAPDSPSSSEPPPSSEP